MGLALSIVTINYNNAIGLTDTIKSVADQVYKDYQYIVIDGGSTDNSLDIIKQSKFIKYWVSERDSGIYNAMNKGIRAAEAEYVLFLNSGDVLNDRNVLMEVVPYLQEYDIVYGDLKFVNSQGSYEYYYPDSLNLNFFIEKSLPHPASFIRRSLFDVYGLYNEELKICSDWEFFMKLVCIKGVSYKHISRVISCFDNNGISSNADNRRKIFFEKNDVLKRDFNFSLDEYNEILGKANGIDLLKKSRFFTMLKKVGLFKYINY